MSWWVTSPLTDGVFRKQFANVAYLYVSTTHFLPEQFPKLLGILRPSGDSSHGQCGYRTNPLFYLLKIFPPALCHSQLADLHPAWSKRGDISGSHKKEQKQNPEGDAQNAFMLPCLSSLLSFLCFWPAWHLQSLRGFPEQPLIPFHHWTFSDFYLTG